MLNHSSLPPSTPPEFRLVVDLLRFLADPAGTEKRLLDIAQAIDEQKKAAALAEDERGKLAAVLAKQDETIKAAAAAHENELVAASLNFEKVCRERERDVKNREIAVADRERQVAATEKAASELKADLERRLSALRSIAS